MWDRLTSNRKQVTFAATSPITVQDGKDSSVDLKKHEQLWNTEIDIAELNTNIPNLRFFFLSYKSNLAQTNNTKTLS